MNAVPQRWFRRRMTDILNGVPEDYYRQSGDLKECGYGVDGLIIHCDIADPPSMRGRPVNVWIRGEEVEWLMMRLREIAIERRSKGEVNTD